MRLIRAIALMLSGLCVANAQSFEITPSRLTFVSSGFGPPPQSLTISGRTDNTWFLRLRCTESTHLAGWLKLHYSSCEQNVWPPATLAVYVEPRGLAPGTYDEDIEVVIMRIVDSTSYPGARTFLPVRLVINAPATLRASKQQLAFQHTPGDSAPAAQSVEITRDGTQGPLAFTPTVATLTGGNWLRATSSSPSTPATLTVRVDPAGLTLGEYLGTVFLESYGFNPLSIMVRLALIPRPRLSLDPTQVAFRSEVGGPPPSPQSLALAATEGPPVNFTAATTGEAWLSVTPTTGVAPANLAVAVNPAGLVAGTYQSAVTVSESGTGSPLVARVTYTVDPQRLPILSSVVNAASNLPSPIAPGEIVTLVGVFTSPLAPATARLDTSGKVGTTLANVRVLFEGVAGPMIYTQGSQIAAVVPYTVDGRETVRVLVEHRGLASLPLTLPVVRSAPAIFTADASGKGQAVVIHEDGSRNSVTNPAPRGSIVTFFVTGEGQTSPPGEDGKLATTPLPLPILPVVVGINNAGAEVLYAGAAPGLIAGLMQVNVRIPDDAAPGGAIPLVIKIGETFSPPGLTIAIREEIAVRP